MFHRSLTALIAATVLVAAPHLTPVAVAGKGAILIAAGDIAGCRWNADDKVGAMIAERRGVVLTLGDNVYPEGSRRHFRRCYDPAWGVLKDRTRPSPGNHDYLTEGASGYFDYFGEAAGPGYYAFRRGGWRIYSLNSEVIDQAQLEWLRDDLDDNPTRCVLAYFHQPRFSSRDGGGVREVKPFWEILNAAGADVILSGHAHSYERFAPQTPEGEASRSGIRLFVVGTGGAPQHEFVRIATNSEVRQTGTYGALKLRLQPEGYTWRFLRAAGEKFKDSGSGSCH